MILSDIFNHDTNRMAIFSGNDLRKMPCYPDTNVFINAFVENPNDPTHNQQKKININESIKFFSSFDGPHLFTSPFVAAEFVYTAVRKFGKTQNEACNLFSDIFKKHKFSMKVPQINLLNGGQIKLPPIYDYSIKLDGKFINGVDKIDISQTFGKGYLITTKPYYFQNDKIIIIDKIDFNSVQWLQATLSHALTDVLLESTFNASPASVEPPDFQDSLVVSFARGFQYTQFITCDLKLVERLKKTCTDQRKIKPFIDVEVLGLHEYLDNVDKMNAQSKSTP